MTAAARAQIVQVGTMGRVIRAAMDSAATVDAQTADWPAEGVTQAAEPGVSGLTHYAPTWDAAGDMALAVRPTHAAPDALTVAVNVALGGFPAGFLARITAPNGVAQEVTIPADGALIFTAAGPWTVEARDGWGLSPPQPQARATWTIEVT